MSVNGAAVKRLEELFTGLGRDGPANPRRPSVVVVERKVDSACDVHGRRASLSRDHHFHRSSVSVLPTVKRRDSMPPMALTSPRRRDSLALPTSPPMREMEHPSAFPSFLRQNDSASSRKDSRANRNSIASFPSLRRDSVASNYSTYNPPAGGLRDWNRDSMGSVGCLLRRMSGVNRRFSIDSLDSRRNSWDPGRRASGVSVTWEDYKEASRDKPVGKQNDIDSAARPRFVAVTALEDVQAVRCAEFHPAGNVYAVGSNSRTLRICTYPDTSHLREDHKTYQPTVVFKRTKHHKGSLYCIAWSPAGDLLATGSNDKTVKLMRFNADTTNLEGQEVELTMHDGTVRDLCFIEDTTNQSSLLISAGAGDCKIYVTDCATGSPFQALSGHSGNVLSLYNWGGALFVSGSQDKSVRFWDLRTGGCINVVTPTSGPGTRGSPVSSLSVEPSGRLLVSGHEDATCCLYDIRGGRTIKSFQPHTQDVRSVRFSPAAYYLLTAGYDSKLVLTDLQGDLTALLPSVVVATHTDKVISGRWHPKDFTFLSTSADKTAVLWALPPA